MEDPGFVILEAALSNTFIISSNCPNGPNEILSSGKNGLLFKNNNLSDLLSKFDEFKNLNKDQIHSKKILAKKKIKRVGVIANINIEEIKEITENVELDYLQFHGDETPNFLKNVKKALLILYSLFLQLHLGPG